MIRAHSTGKLSRGKARFCGTPSVHTGQRRVVRPHVPDRSSTRSVNCVLGTALHASGLPADACLAGWAEARQQAPGYWAGTIGVAPPGPGAGGTSAPAGVFVLGADRGGGGASICSGSGVCGTAGPPRPFGASPHAGSVAALDASLHAEGGSAATMGAADAVAAATISETDVPAGAIQRRHPDTRITAISGHRRPRPNCRLWRWIWTRSRTSAGSPRLRTHRS